MKIVIDIPDNIYKSVCNSDKINVTNFCIAMMYTIKNGIPLSEYCEFCIYKPTEGEDD